MANRFYPPKKDLATPNIRDSIKYAIADRNHENHPELSQRRAFQRASAFMADSTAPGPPPSGVNVIVFEIPSLPSCKTKS
jgi:hypothetical protein